MNNIKPRLRSEVAPTDFFLYQVGLIQMLFKKKNELIGWSNWACLMINRGQMRWSYLTISEVKAAACARLFWRIMTFDGAACLLEFNLGIKPRNRIWHLKQTPIQWLPFHSSCVEEDSRAENNPGRQPVSSRRRAK